MAEIEHRGIGERQCKARTAAAEPYQPGGDAGAPSEFWLATFEDPDGNYFQLASPMPPQEG